MQLLQKYRRINLKHLQCFRCNIAEIMAVKLEILERNSKIFHVNNGAILIKYKHQHIRKCFSFMPIQPILPKI